MQASRLITLQAIAACVRVDPLLQATSWQGEIAVVFHRCMLCTACDGPWPHLRIGPPLLSPFSLHRAENVVNVLYAPRSRPGGSVWKIAAASDIADQMPGWVNPEPCASRRAITRGRWTDGGHEHGFHASIVIENRSHSHRAYAMLNKGLGRGLRVLDAGIA